MTLHADILGPNAQSGQESTCTNKSGWTVTAVLQEDYYLWVNDFKATHPKYGIVEGNFENTVKATSQEAFNHFWKNHEPEAWDYWDI